MFRPHPEDAGMNRIHMANGEGELAVSVLDLVAMHPDRKSVV
jgi:hypothetical protein